MYFTLEPYKGFGIVFGGKELVLILVNYIWLVQYSTSNVGVTFDSARTKGYFAPKPNSVLTISTFDLFLTDIFYGPASIIGIKRHGFLKNGT